MVNAAGLASADVARLVGLDRYTIYPCRGDYFTLRSAASYRHLIYPVKDKTQPGLGIHLTLDRSGAYRLGPDAEYVDRCDDFRPAEHKLPQFLEAAARLLGPLTADQLAYEGCGIRPKLRAPHEPAERDFVLEEHPAGFVHLIGIESPGLTASLDLADRVAAPHRVRRRRPSGAASGLTRWWGAFAAGDGHRDGQVAGDVEGGAAHVEQAVDAEDDAQALGRHADQAEDHGDDRQRSGRDAGGADAGQHGDQHDRGLLAQAAARCPPSGRGTAP